MLYLSRSGCTDLVQHDISIAALYRKLLVTIAVFVRLQAAIIHIAVDIGDRCIIGIVDFDFQRRLTDNIQLCAKYSILASIQPRSDILTSACFQYTNFLFSAWRKIKYSLFHRAIITI